MPCYPAVARILLKQGKAKCKRKTPFTIKLNYQIEDPEIQPITCGQDTGSSEVGTAAVNDETGEVYYRSKMTIRNDIKKKMDQRRAYRRTRRNRKTRYRKPRFLNRGNSMKKGRISPTVTSKIHSHQKEIDFVKSILPIQNVVLETGLFDPHLMKNPDLKDPEYAKIGYQQGPNYGYANTHAKVLCRDHHECQHCHGKKKDSKLEVHHIQYRSEGGSDEEDNLITLCHTCHTDLHAGKWKLKQKGKPKGTLSHATQMNSIRVQILKKNPDAIETFGFITKANRQMLGLEKDHDIDACVIASRGNPVILNDTIFVKKCIPNGDYQQTKGKRSETRIPTGKIFGLRKYDKVQYRDVTYFIKGRFSTGYAKLMDINGISVSFEPGAGWGKIPRMKDMKRLSARKSWIIEANTDS